MVSPAVNPFFSVELTAFWVSSHLIPVKVKPLMTTVVGNVRLTATWPALTERVSTSVMVFVSIRAQMLVTFTPQPDSSHHSWTITMNSVFPGLLNSLQCRPGFTSTTQLQQALVTGTVLNQPNSSGLCSRTVIFYCLVLWCQKQTYEHMTVSSHVFVRWMLIWQNLYRI